MRAVRFHDYGGPSVLRFESVSEPTLRPDEVLVATHMIGVNPTETYTREGYRDHDLPRIPGADFAGVVEAVGESVKSVAPGDRVFGTGLQNDRQGSYAEYLPVREDRLAHLPDSVSFEQGAGIGIVGVTAWQTLVAYGNLSPGDTCLIHGASGGVGHVAVQLASQAGARVLGTVGSDQAAAAVESLGADTVLTYASTDLETAILDVAPDGVDVVLDHRLEEYLQLDLDVGAPGVTIVGIGRATDQPEIENIWPAIHTDATIQISSMSNTPDLPAVLDRLATLLSREQLRVVVDRIYDLEDAESAHRALTDAHVVGKVLLRP